MDPRHDVKANDLVNGNSYEENDGSKRTELISEVNVSFDVKTKTLDNKKLSAEQSTSNESDDDSLEEKLDESGIELSFQFCYDPNKDEHKKIIKHYQHQYNAWFIGGILSRSCLYEKYSIDEDEYGDDYDAATEIDDIGNHILKITFKLPELNSDYLLRLISIFNDAIKILHEDKVKISFTIVNIINEIKKAYTITMLDNCNCAVMINQLNTILSINSDLKHDDAISLLYCFNALKSFDLSLFTLPKDLTQLSNEIFKIVDTLFTKQFVKPADNPSTDEEFQKQISRQRNDELNEFLKRINLWQRIKLYSPSLGKPADDGGVYVWHYTEWFLLRSMHVALNKAGDVFFDITKEKEGSAYLQYYAPGKSNHEIFEKEMLALAPHINLQFPEKVEWHNAITFKPECSNFLFNMKLHFDVDVAKMLLKARNNHRFFQEAWKTGVLRENLPEDMVKLIFTLALGPVIAPEALAAPLNQRYAMQC